MINHALMYIYIPYIYINRYTYSSLLSLNLQPPVLHLNSIWQTLYQTIGPVAGELYQVGSTMVGKHLVFWGEKGMLQVGNKHSRKGLGKIHIGELWGFPLFLIFFLFFWEGGVMLQQKTKRTILWRWVKDVSYSHWGWVIQTCDGRTSQYFFGVQVYLVKCFVAANIRSTCTLQTWRRWHGPPMYFWDSYAGT